jgi:hypothetical protein
MSEPFVAEFEDAEQAAAGAEYLKSAGARLTGAFSPYPAPRLEEALGVRRTKLPLFVLVAGMVGALTAYLVIWGTNALDYPIDVGGRPYNSVPTHIPIMFETTVLFAGVTAFVLVLLLSRLPRLHHGLFEIEGFERTSLDRIWLTFLADELTSELTGELLRRGAAEVRLLRGAP